MSRRALLAAGCVSGLCACGPPTLEGSLTEIMDLHYTRTDVSASSASVAVRFLAPQGTGENLVLEVGARLGGIMLEAGVPIDLAQTAPDGTQRGIVTRDVFDDPRRTFPLIRQGQLLLRSLPMPQTKVAGELSVSFVVGTQYANGRTVFSKFEAQIP